MTGSGPGMFDWHVFGSFVGYLALMPGIGLLAGTYLNRKIVAIVAVSLVTENRLPVPRVMKRS